MTYTAFSELPDNVHLFIKDGIPFMFCSRCGKTEELKPEDPISTVVKYANDKHTNCEVSHGESA